ncbi:MAG: outer membrane beta-barrel protein [Alphaproteobacteria bacterium]|nr:outer membrane beta-barrel protein [Alphaproteobacteria bacterium]
MYGSRRTGAAVLAAIALLGLPVAAVADEPASRWTGPYAGLALGARWLDSDWETESVCPTIGCVPDGTARQSFDSTALRIGAYGGYNWRFAPHWVAGVEADLGWADNRRTRNFVPGTIDVLPPFPLSDVSDDSSSVRASLDGSIRGRIGFLATPTTLFYGTGGPAVLRTKVSASCDNDAFTTYCTEPSFAGHQETNAHTRFGWTAGAGVEQMWDQVLLRIEYRYAHFGSTNEDFFNYVSDTGDDQVSAEVDYRTHTATLGIAYRF